jgi:hypothetical protein
MKDDKEHSELPDMDKLFSHYSARVERQDSLINQRLKWMMTSQGVLFSLVAAFLKLGTETTDQSHLVYFASIGVIVGFVISISGFLGVLGGQKAIRQLVNKWEKITADVYPALIGENDAVKCGFNSARLIPIALLVGWILVGIIIGIEISA